MCSIAGIFYLDPRKINKDDLASKIRNALFILKRRGPDETSFVFPAPCFVMGGNRLIIRGDRKNGSMPFIDNFGNTCFYNGEIYNFKQWKKNAYSDGEAILPAYNKNDIEVFNLIDGEFAISIWDNRKKRLILARDPFGTKPLYFSLNKKRLIYASSASAINAIERHSLCRSTKSPVYCHSYAVQEPYTSYKGIWTVPPGHLLIADSQGVKMTCYHSWSEKNSDSVNTKKCFEILEKSLKNRLHHKGPIAIPLSGGIDSGIIAFMADKMKLNYHLFSVIEIFNSRTEEADFIMARLKKLKNYKSVHLLKCNENDYHDAINEMFESDYYDSEKFDNGNILMHTVLKAVHKAGIRVVIDGTGGDELFHGYKFKNDFKPISGWPKFWKKSNYYYSIFSSLLDYTSKSDRAGGHFSLETRYPFQNVELMNEASRLKISETLKWPLRQFLLSRLDYGKPLDVDLNLKFGFSIKNKDKLIMINDMKRSWCKFNHIKRLPTANATKFPFAIGKKEYE